MSIKVNCTSRAGINNILVIFFACLWLSSFFFAEKAAALTIPEKLIYDLTWTGIKAGTATQEITADKGEIKIVSIARSADWITVFFPVEDRIESVLTSNPDSNFGHSKSYSLKTREGNHRRDREIQFNHAKGIAYYKDNLNGEKKELPIVPATLDTLSSFYYVRTLNLEVGKSVFLTILDNTKTWKVEVQVLRKEKIKTSLGTFSTIVIKPLMQSEGIIDRKGDMLIWLTDDSRLLPVKMKTKVKIGSVTATLVGGTYKRQ
ncbi:MAG: DUF3108 domain-containing protein [Deltaproteobacteria bacterium]|nr:DUF3108 domain-containing protein [Deltaproteobacteria bacterium]TLN04543.1 MAG: DUF3108 domain-containing protein [bacterium]